MPVFHRAPGEDEAFAAVFPQGGYPGFEAQALDRVRETGLPRRKPSATTAQRQRDRSAPLPVGEGVGAQLSPWGCRKRAAR